MRLGVAEIIVSSARPMGHCPRCGMPAARVHSRYERTLQDLPWQGTRVKIRWRSRKFFCDTPGCEQRIFTERLPTITWRYGRRTVRCRDAVLCLGLTLGGEEGSRVANYLGLSLSGDTLLREIRNAPRVPFDEPHVIGVDDWALRRGHEYGTLIVDLERHRPLDLLPGRTWEVFSDWLAQHPSVEVVSRDRAECYAHGANAGALRPATSPIAGTCYRTCAKPSRMPPNVIHPRFDKRSKSLRRRACSTATDRDVAGREQLLAHAFEADARYFQAGNAAFASRRALPACPRDARVGTIAK